MDKAGNKIETISDKVVVSKAQSAEGWKKEGFKLVRGKDVLEIGDVVHYTATGTSYNGGWKVLGADDDGNLLIMSASDVDFKYFNEGLTLEGGQDAWLNGADELYAICEAYGNGEGAIDVRSIRVEDIDSVTGYDKTEYGEGELYQYNNEVTYSYNGSLYPAYNSEVTGEGKLSGEHYDGFYFYNYDIEDFDEITAEELKSGEEGTEFAKLTSDFYAYSVDEVEIPEKASLMLFDDNNAFYWLASPYVYADTYCACFGLRCIESGNVSDHDLWNSNGDILQLWLYGVRAVVTLSSDITFTDDSSSEVGWSY